MQFEQHEQNRYNIWLIQYTNLFDHEELFKSLFVRRQRLRESVSEGQRSLYEKDFL